MRAGAASGHVGHFHEAGFYGSDAEFRDLIVPFAEEGLAAGEPVIIGYDERKNDLLRSWLPDSAAVEFITDNSLYATPAKAIATYQRLFEFHLAMGAGQVRIAGEVPHRGNGGSFAGWDRYECAINTVWQHYPVWGRCLYDTATAPAAVLDAVRRTHPRIVYPSGERRPSSSYQTPAQFRALAAEPDPVERSEPVVQQTVRSPADARHALERAGSGSVSDAVLDDLLIGTSEAVANALRHGRAPAVIRIWVAPQRIVVHVQDGGPGPADQLAGLAPAAHGAADPGLGLWLMHQLDLDVALIYGEDGFTVRLTAGAVAGFPAKGRL